MGWGVGGGRGKKRSITTETDRGPSGAENQRRGLHKKGERERRGGGGGKKSSITTETNNKNYLFMRMNGVALNKVVLKDSTTP